MASIRIRGLHAPANARLWVWMYGNWGSRSAWAGPDRPDPPAHDAFTRLLTRLDPDPDTLWGEARPQVTRGGGVLVIDDSTLDTPYATAIDLGPVNDFPGCGGE